MSSVENYHFDNSRAASAIGRNQRISRHLYFQVLTFIPVTCILSDNYGFGNAPKAERLSAVHPGKLHAFRTEM